MVAKVLPARANGPERGDRQRPIMRRVIIQALALMRYPVQVPRARPWSSLPKKVIGMRRMEISGRWTSSCARKLGLDRNPLRRRTDRAEAWLRIALVLAFLIGAPLAAWGAGNWAGSVAPTAAHLRQAGEHHVPATLLRSVPGDSDQWFTVRFAWVKARWTVPGGPVRTGYVQAPVGSRADSTVQVWLDRSGRPTEPPLPPSQIRGWILMMAILAPAALALLLLAVMGILGGILYRRRLASWGQAWSAIGPQWTRGPR